jgi:hypothetical protein
MNEEEEASGVTEEWRAQRRRLGARALRQLERYCSWTSLPDFSGARVALASGVRSRVLAGAFRVYSVCIQGAVT